MPLTCRHPHVLGQLIVQDQAEQEAPQIEQQMTVMASTMRRMLIPNQVVAIRSDPLQEPTTRTMRENVQKIRSEENSQDTDTDDSLDDNSDCHWERYTVLPETCISFLAGILAL
jgi:Trm5-related predicted tRNA methylase